MGLSNFFFWKNKNIFAVAVFTTIATSFAAVAVVFAATAIVAATTTTIATIATLVAFVAARPKDGEKASPTVYWVASFVFYVAAGIALFA